MFIGIGEKPLKPGDNAPDFTLPSALGGAVTLSDYRGRKVFLFFFRGTWCPNCANHMREIEKDLEQLKAADVHVFGICCQGLEPMTAFMKKAKISFPILSDAERTTAKSYGVYAYLSWDSINIARPSFFYVDEAGIIRILYIVNHQWDRPKVEEIKRLVRSSVAS